MKLKSRSLIATSFTWR